MEPMVTATWLLLALGILGATDILLFHMIAHGIRRHPDSLWELVTHGLRGPTYGALFVIVPNCAVHGLWFWALVALLAFDAGISVWDFCLEKRSRQRLGGLPTAEYLLHMVMAMLFGALAMNVLAMAPEWAARATALSWQPAGIPAWVRSLLAVMAVGVLLSSVLDAIAVVRMRPGTEPSHAR